MKEFKGTKQIHDDIPNLFTCLASQINYESSVNGLDMRAITTCFNNLQSAYKNEKSANAELLEALQLAVKRQGYFSDKELIQAREAIKKHYENNSNNNATNN